MRAYVLITTEIGEARRVQREVSESDLRPSVELIAGAYDLIASVEADSLRAVGEFVVNGIHKIDGVTQTITLLSLDETSPV